MRYAPAPEPVAGKADIGFSPARLLTPTGVRLTLVDVAGTLPRDATPGAPLRGEANVVPLRRPRGEESLWAVVASLGRQDRIAEIYPTREAALADRSWRAAQVAAYAGFLAGARQPVPYYSVTPIRRSDLPKAWRPLPALGFLRGTFI